MEDKYKDIPGRAPRVDYVFGTGLDQSRQEKWKIPDTITITCCVVGGPIKRDKNPNQPYTPDEIRKAAMECIEAGATAVHIHARDDNGNPIPDVNEYVRRMQLIIDPIREKYGDSVVIDGSEFTRPTFEAEQILLDAELSEIAPVNFPGNNRRLMQAEAYLAIEKGVKPAMAIYDDGNLDSAKTHLIDTGIVTKPILWGLLPSYGVGSTPLPDEFAMAEYIMRMVRQIRQIEPESFISVPMSGRGSMYLATQAILMGLDLRIGMEDTYWKWPHKDDIIDSNVKVYKEIKTIAELLGRRQTTANEYRAKLGLPKRGSNP